MMVERGEGFWEDSNLLLGHYAEFVSEKLVAGGICGFFWGRGPQYTKTIGANASK